MRRKRKPKRWKLKHRKKKRDMVWHAKRRVQQRFGLTLTEEKTEQLIRDIRAGMYPTIWKESGTRRWHKVKIDDKEMVAIYDPTRRAFHTFLTLDQARKTIGEIDDL